MKLAGGNGVSAASLLDIDSLSASQILELLAETRSMARSTREQLLKTAPGKTVALLFYEASTRTRISFELAAKSLGATTTLISATSSSIEKGESLVDTGLTLRALGADCIVIRHPCSGAPHTLARHLHIPIINAGDGSHEHPTQALLDAYALLSHRGSLAGLSIAIVGDILHSRVARSNVHLLTKLGAQVRLCGPEELLPENFNEIVAAEHRTQVRVERDLDALLGEVDVLMMLRIQKERLEGFELDVAAYVHAYQLNAERRARMMAGAGGDASRADHPRPGDHQRGGGWRRLVDPRADQQRRAGAARRARAGAGGGMKQTKRSYWIRGGTVVTDALELRDIHIENGIITQIERAGSSISSADIDATGLFVAAGLIDMHVHLREPGQSFKETIATGTAAAAAGGFTSVCCMPNTHPVNDSVEITRWMQARERGAIVNVFPIAAATVGSMGAELTDYAALRDAGAVAVTDDGKPVLEDERMRASLMAAKRAGLPVIQHAEDTRRTKGAPMNAGATALRLGRAAGRRRRRLRSSSATSAWPKRPVRISMWRISRPPERSMRSAAPRPAE